MELLDDELRITRIMNGADITNLKELIELCKDDLDKNEPNVTATLDLEDLKCLRNVLDRLKEYIQINEEHRKLNGELRKRITELEKELNEENKRCMFLAIERQDYFEKYQYHLKQNESLTREFSYTIPKQKIKDKIEEITDKTDDLQTLTYLLQIKALQELLEE